MTVFSGLRSSSSAEGSLFQGCFATLLFFPDLKATTVGGRVLIHDDLLGNDVDHQRVSRGHVEAAWLGDDPHASVSGEILIQGGVDDSRDLARQQTRSRFFFSTSVESEV